MVSTSIEDETLLDRIIDIARKNDLRFRHYFIESQNQTNIKLLLPADLEKIIEVTEEVLFGIFEMDNDEPMEYIAYGFRFPVSEQKDS